MQEYEGTAFLSLEKLKERHDSELIEVRAKFIQEASKKHGQPKELVELRNLEKKNFAIKDYEQAE